MKYIFGNYELRCIINLQYNSKIQRNIDCSSQLRAERFANNTVPRTLESAAVMAWITLFQHYCRIVYADSFIRRCLIAVTKRIRLMFTVVYNVLSRKDLTVLNASLGNYRCLNTRAAMHVQYCHSHSTA